MGRRRLIAQYQPEVKSVKYGQENYTSAAAAHSTSRNNIPLHLVISYQGRYIYHVIWRFNPFKPEFSIVIFIHYKWNKWNESGFRPPLCTYRLNWARRTSWGWWDDWDDTVLQTQDSKFEPWRSEAEHATSRSRRLPTILTFTRGWGRNNFVSFKPPRPGTEPRTLAWKTAVLTIHYKPRIAVAILDL